MTKKCLLRVWHWRHVRLCVLSIHKFFPGRERNYSRFVFLIIQLRIYPSVWWCFCSQLSSRMCKNEKKQKNKTKPSKCCVPSLTDLAIVCLPIVTGAAHDAKYFKYSRNANSMNSKLKKKKPPNGKMSWNNKLIEVKHCRMGFSAIR